VREILRLLRSTIVDFFHRGGLTLAASVAFFSLLSFFPLIFLLLYFVSFVVSSDRIGYEFLLGFLQGFLPDLGANLAEEIRRVSSEEGLRWGAFFTFTWFGLLVFYEMQYAINVIFDGHRRRSLIVPMGLAVALLGLAEVLMLLSYAVTKTMRLLVVHAPHFAGMDMVALAAHDFMVPYVLPFVLVFLSTTCLYRFLPVEPPTWLHAAAGALVLTILWESAKFVFKNYLEGLSVYGRMYGSLMTVVLFLLWVYYASALLLLGATLVRRLQQEGERAVRRS